MFVPRFAVAFAAAAALFQAAPASAQFFIKPVDLKGERVTGEEPGILGPGLPGATQEELRAALVWSLRAALNVAALQCQFEPTLLTLGNYNAILSDHARELKSSYDTLEKYFVRKAKNVKKAGQTELDRFGTRIYSSFSTVGGQLTFCQAAASVGHDALFVRRGGLGDLAKDRMAELRKSLKSWGEQHRAPPRPYLTVLFDPMPPFHNDKCWKRGVYQERKCGALNFRYTADASAGRGRLTQAQ
ncbi:hypothetical protein ACFQ1E_08290 [Sphingomonas canadensis]|uniref:Uncharacterized protein n=1 Tax=Sphingomonas canadensis TaxID=1219257 RepID=A0ABW3H592_9SPHN|nr:hypothetical protein [Sphingomonas canadensis]MCW3836036.1 hypothetical protein [Sphingomonas canadensis]